MSGVGGGLTSNQIRRQLRIRQFEYFLETQAFGFRRCHEMLAQVATQQDVELLHAAPAAPGQAPQPRGIRRRVQCCRSAIIFLISPMARAGFRSFGQASAQFMIVWQRYRRNASSNSSSRSPVDSSRLSMIQR